MLTIDHIHRLYPNGRGLVDLDLVVTGGEIVALVGPNGSGKSTALDIIAGVAVGQSGTCLLDGRPTSQMATKADIGFLEQDAFFYPDMPVGALIDFLWAEKYSHQPNDDARRLLETFDLGDYSRRRIGSLSQGLRQRLGLITALMHRPALIVLDEPTNGLDTKSLLSLKDELVTAQSAGCQVIVSSHVLDFVHAIATRVVFLRDGVVVADLHPDDGVSLDDTYRTLYLTPSPGLS